MLNLLYRLRIYSLHSIQWVHTFVLAKNNDLDDRQYSSHQKQASANMAMM